MSQKIIDWVLNSESLSCDFITGGGYYAFKDSKPPQILVLMLAAQGATQSSALFSIKFNIIIIPTNNLLTRLIAWLIWFCWTVLVTAAVCLSGRIKTTLVLMAFHYCKWERITIKGNYLFHISHFTFRLYNWASPDVFTAHISCYRVPEMHTCSVTKNRKRIKLADVAWLGTSLTSWIRGATTPVFCVFLKHRYNTLAECLVSIKPFYDM